MKTVSETHRANRRDWREGLVSWAAIAASAGAVLAWAACCVLPMTLALLGVGLTATSAIAGQRTWLTVLAAVILGAGWLIAWRRSRACRIDPSCPRLSPVSLTLMSVASILLVVAVAWQSLIEPRLLHLILAARGQA